MPGFTAAELEGNGKRLPPGGRERQKKHAKGGGGSGLKIKKTHLINNPCFELQFVRPSQRDASTLSSLLDASLQSRWMPHNFSTYRLGRMQVLDVP